MSVVASVVSAPTPIDGNDHNSSPDFQFIDLPTGGDIAVEISDNANAGNITFTLWEDVNNRRDDEIEEQLSNGSTFSVDRVEEGTNYYIGDPDNADNESFLVNFVV